MKTSIVGFDHSPENIHALIADVRGEIMDMGLKKVRVGVEALEDDWMTRRTWREVIRRLRKTKGVDVEIVFLDSPTGDRIAQRTRRMERQMDEALKSGGVSAWDLGRMRWEMAKGNYAKLTLRSGSIANRIESNMPHIAILGGAHAVQVGQRLRIEPRYVGIGKAKVEEIVGRMEAEIGDVTRMREMRRREKARGRMSKRRR